MIGLDPESLGKMTFDDVLECASVPLLSSEPAGVVYLLAGKGRFRRFHKIGRTRDPVGRLRALRARFGDDVRFSHIIWTDDPVYLERVLHMRFEGHRQTGIPGTKWFHLSNQELCFLKGLQAVDAGWMCGFIHERARLLRHAGTS